MNDNKSEKNNNPDWVEFSVDRDVFLKSLNSIVGACDKRGLIPIFSNIMLDVREDSVVLTASSADITMSSCCVVAIKSVGTIVINSNNLLDATRKTKGELRISSNGSEFIMKSGSCVFKFPCFPASDFPCVDESQNVSSFVIKAVDLVKLFSRTSFAIPSESIKYNLAGSLLSLRSDHISAVATNGHRLALARLSSDFFSMNNIDSNFDVIVPRKTVHEIIKLSCDNFDIKISVAEDENRMKISTEGVIIVSKLIAAKFPSYENVIPLDNTNVINISTKELIEVIERVCVIYSDKTQAVRFKLSGNKMKVYTYLPDTSSAEEEVSIQYNGSDMEISFNYFYILDFLRNLYDENVIIALGGQKTAALFKPADDSVDFSYVIMPMTI